MSHKKYALLHYSALVITRSLLDLETGRKGQSGGFLLVRAIVDYICYKNLTSESHSLSHLKCSHNSPPLLQQHILGLGLLSIYVRTHFYRRLRVSIFWLRKRIKNCGKFWGWRSIA